MSVVYVTLFQCVHLNSSGVICIVIYSVIVNRPHANVDAKSLILGEDSSEFYHSRGPLTSACGATRTCRNVRYPVAMGWQGDLEEAVLNKLDL
jgi:hypothetical protein